jgi:DNA-binding transcriptional regulator GbsR (MarR family)
VTPTPVASSGERGPQGGPPRAQEGEHQRRSPAQAIWAAELHAADAIGAIMELWGFRRQLGRVWTVLFLSERPLHAPELCERLQISTGLLSMTLTELRRWEAVRSVEVPGDRKEHFEAEVNVWKLVRKVLSERERAAVQAALEAVESALTEVRAAIGGTAGDPQTRGAARFRLERLEQLASLCRVGLGLLRALIDGGKANAGPLKALSELLARRG